MGEAPAESVEDIARKSVKGGKSTKEKLSNAQKKAREEVRKNLEGTTDTESVGLYLPEEDYKEGKVELKDDVERKTTINKKGPGILGLGLLTSYERVETNSPKEENIRELDRDGQTAAQQRQIIRKRYSRIKGNDLDRIQEVTEKTLDSDNEVLQTETTKLFSKSRDKIEEKLETKREKLEELDKKESDSAEVEAEKVNNEIRQLEVKRQEFTKAIDKLSTAKATQKITGSVTLSGENGERITDALMDLVEK